ncbi:SH3 and PX domain-containing protein 2A, partial [Bienertia sinuspersici]
PLSGGEVEGVEERERGEGDGGKRGEHWRWKERSNLLEMTRRGRLGRRSEKGWWRWEVANNGGNGRYSGVAKIKEFKETNSSFKFLSIGIRLKIEFNLPTFQELLCYSSSDILFMEQRNKIKAKCCPTSKDFTKPIGLIQVAYCCRPVPGCVRQSKGKSLQISSFKGNIHNDNAGDSSSKSTSPKSSVKISYLPEGKEENLQESPTAHDTPVSCPSESNKSVTQSQTIRALFRKWLSLLQTGAAAEAGGDILKRSPQIDHLPEEKATSSKERGEVLKVVLCYFLGLDATIMHSSLCSCKCEVWQSSFKRIDPLVGHRSPNCRSLCQAVAGDFCSLCFLLQAIC